LISYIFNVKFAQNTCPLCRKIHVDKPIIHFPQRNIIQIRGQNYDLSQIRLAAPLTVPLAVPLAASNPVNDDNQNLLHRVEFQDESDQQHRPQVSAIKRRRKLLIK
jgi:hypothetical protein